MRWNTNPWSLARPSSRFATTSSGLSVIAGHRAPEASVSNRFRISTSASWGASSASATTSRRIERAGGELLNSRGEVIKVGLRVRGGERPLRSAHRAVPCLHPGRRGHGPDAVAGAAIWARVDGVGVGHRGHRVRPSRGGWASLSVSVVAVFAALQRMQRHPSDQPRNVPCGASGMCGAGFSAVIAQSSALGRERTEGTSGPSGRAAPRARSARCTRRCTGPAASLRGGLDRQEVRGAGVIHHLDRALHNRGGFLLGRW